MKKLHHIGIAVNDMDKYIKIFCALGGELEFRAEAKEYEADCAFIKFENVFIELITGTTGPHNHINRFIQKYGVGIHHIAIEGGGKTPGAIPGMMVSFNRPDDANRILIEKVKDGDTYKSFARLRSRTG